MLFDRVSESLLKSFLSKIGTKILVLDTDSTAELFFYFRLGSFHYQNVSKYHEWILRNQVLVRLFFFEILKGDR